MKTLTQSELKDIISFLKKLQDYEVQGVYGEEDFFSFKLWKEGIAWLNVNLKGAVPFVFGTEKLIPAQKKLTKPVFNFLNKHLKQMQIKDIEVLEEFGRVVEIYFKEDLDTKIQLRLFRGGVNIGVFHNKKNVFLYKPAPLEKAPTVDIERKSRTLEVIFNEIQASLEAVNKKAAEKTDKTKIALEKIKEALEFHKTDPFLRLARFLEKDQELPENLKSLLQTNKTKQENIDYCFEQHKLKDQKIKRLERRQAELEKSDSGVKEGVKEEGVRKETSNLKENFKGIPHIYLAENVRAFCGRKAKENLELLRKAKAWYVWLHLKDYPSSHMIIEKDKKGVLSDEQLKKAALFLFYRGAPKKLLSSPEVKFEIIFTECRFVRPVKGAKAGLVTAQNVKSRLFIWNKESQFSFK